MQVRTNNGGGGDLTASHKAGREIFRQAGRQASHLPFMIFHLRTVGNFSNGYTKKSGRTSLGRPQIPEKAGVKNTDLTRKKRDAQKRFQPKAQKKFRLRRFWVASLQSLRRRGAFDCKRGEAAIFGPLFLAVPPPERPRKQAVVRADIAW